MSQCSGLGGRGPRTVPVRRRVPRPGVVRAPLRRAGAGSPIGRDLRGSRRLGALGRAMCRSSCVPPPASRSLLREGGRPFGSGGVEGRRSCGPQAGGRAGGGGEGGLLRRPPPPRPCRASACHPSPRGILELRASPGGLGRQARPGWPPTGLCGGGGGGRGGVISSPRFAPSPSPGRPLKGPLRLRRPGRRRSPVGR